MKIRITCVLLWALLSVLVTDGAAQTYLSRTYTVGEGLPSAEVFGFAQDDSGRIWFATRSGMTTYDGQEWQSVPQSAGLPIVTVRLCDDGLMWALAPGVGLLLAFDPDHPELAEAERLKPPVSGTGSTFAVAGSEDDRTIAVASRNRGVRLFRNGSWRSPNEGKELPSDRVNGIVPWRGGFAVATDAGLALLTVDGEVRDPGVVPPGTAVAAVATGSGERELWLIVGNRLLSVVDGVAEVAVENLPLPESCEFPFALIPNAPKVMYLGGCSSVFRLDLISGSLKEVHRQRGVEGHWGSVPFVDREGSVWVRTAGGAGKLSSLRFATYRHQDGLMEDEVTAVCEPRRGTIVLGHNNGLTVMGEGEPRRIPLLPPVGELYLTNRVMDLEPDGRGSVWIAGASRGVGHLGSTDVVTWCGPDEGVEGETMALHLDETGRLWAGGDALFVNDGSGFSEVELGLNKSLGIRSISKGEDGGILLATSRFGLVTVVEGLAQRVAGPQEREAKNVYASHFDSTGRLWVGTRAGLLVREGLRLVFSGGSLPAIDSPVFMILEDGAGQLWFGTENGVVRWDGSEARRYTVNDGLAGRETNRAAGLAASDGRVWIGTETGVSAYERELDRRSETPPLAELVGIEVEGRPVGVTDELDLRHPRSTIEFHFRGVSLFEEDAVTYSFLLDGSGDDWSPALPAGRRSVRFTELTPGRYTFRVKAANACGIWSEEAVSPPIRVRAALWKQWWFVGGAGCLAVFLVFFVGRTTVRWRYVERLEREVKQRRRAEDEVRRLNLDLEKRVEERTSELQEVNRELEAYSYTVAHDLKGPLNSISMLSELLLMKHSGDLPDAATDLIEQELDEVSRMGALIESLLELSHVGRTEVQRVHVDVSSAANEAVAELRLQDPDRDVQVEIEPGLVVDGDPELIKVVMTNLLGNAWKFTVGKPEASIEVGAERIEDERVLFVRDNGAGFDMEGSDTIFRPFKRLHSKTEYEGSGIGLATVERIVNRHGGRVWASSEEGAGATFYLCL